MFPDNLELLFWFFKSCDFGILECSVLSLLEKKKAGVSTGMFEDLVVPKINDLHKGILFGNELP
jgi:hypothetical protein